MLRTRISSIFQDNFFARTSNYLKNPTSPDFVACWGSNNYKITVKTDSNVSCQEVSTAASSDSPETNKKVVSVNEHNFNPLF